MPEAIPVSPELSRGVTALAPALVAAARGWTLYPHEHQAVQDAVDPEALNIDPLACM
jgi:hypothetical protein